MHQASLRTGTAPFRLMQWFGGLSSIIIVGIAVAHAWLISSFLSTHLFQREGELSRDFVQNILVGDGSIQFLSHPDDPGNAVKFQNTIDHIQRVRDVLRANIYAADGTLLWSSDAQLTGQHFSEENDELVDALAGKLVIHPAHISHWLKEKQEHQGIDPDIRYFVECYIPVIDPATEKVVGAVEFYRAPAALTQAVQEGRYKVWLTALASALALFVALFWLVRKADRTIKQQHMRLVETETLALMGELTASVAHNIRNPLASIRSAAELTLEMPGEDNSEQARDIMREVDRIGKQINELLNFSAEGAAHAARMDLAYALQQSIAEHVPIFERGGLSLEWGCTASDPYISADAAMLQQVLQSLLANASEAMQAGGRCEVRLQDAPGNQLQLQIQDTGIGIPAEVHPHIFRPFFTTKPKGLGLGLTQARKTIERFGGTLQLQSNPTVGATVTIHFPRVR